MTYTCIQMPSNMLFSKMSSSQSVVSNSRVGYLSMNKCYSHTQTHKNIVNTLKNRLTFRTNHEWHLKLIDKIYPLHIVTITYN